MPSTQSDLTRATKPAALPGPPGIPDWTSFDGDLSCPRCGYNLRSLTGVCCPECGLGLDWAAIVSASARQEHVSLFEYQWRKRPIRSLLRSLVMSVTPWRTWNVIPLTAAPRIGPLLVQPFLVLLLAIPLKAAITLACQLLVDFFSQPAYMTWDSAFMLFHYIQYEIRSVEFYILIGASLFISLSIFRQSIREYHVSRSHLLRITVVVIIALVVHRLPEPIVWSILNGWGRTWGLINPFVVFAIWDIAFIGLMAWSLARAVHDYLCIPRAWPIAVSVMTLLVLFWITVVITGSIFVGTWDNRLALLAEDTWPGLAYLVNAVFGF